MACCTSVPPNLPPISRNERASELARRALSGLAGFVKALKVKYQDVEVGIDFEPEPGLADNGDLELDLQDLLAASGEAAQRGNSALAVFIDEMQYVKELDLAALVMALHRASQRRLPVVLIGAGSPQLREWTGRAKSYAERLFDFPQLGPLSEEASRVAIAKPAGDEGALINEDALSRIVESTQGYPYFLQEWGKHSWDAAVASPITIADVEQGSKTAIAALDASFFRVRFDRLTPNEKLYLRAMSELGAGPHRSGVVADVLDREVTSLAPARSKLIAKGYALEPESWRHRFYGTAV